MFLLIKSFAAADPFAIMEDLSSPPAATPAATPAAHQAPGLLDLDALYSAPALVPTGPAQQPRQPSVFGLRSGQVPASPLLGSTAAATSQADDLMGTSYGLQLRGQPLLCIYQCFMLPS